VSEELDRIPLILWGASSHALVVADIAEATGLYEIVGYLDDRDSTRAGQRFNGGVVIGGSESLQRLREAGVRHAALAFGDNRPRLDRFEMLSAAGWTVVTLVHPRATVAASARLAGGSVVSAGAVVNPAVVVGAAAIVNTGAVIEHECELGAGAHVGTGARVGGKTHVGRCATVEIGAIVAAGCRIGDGSVVGAGSVVLHDVPAGVLAYGTPATMRRPIGEVARDSPRARRHPE
jgi:acetyltransferase EpsM